MKILQIDAFTNQAFSGNPAAVCLLESPKSDTWMQQLAQEMNLSETAFLLPEGDGYRLRWFTPAVEVDLCGHATLASAHALWSEGLLPPHQAARFQTRSGLLTAQLQSNVLPGDWIALNFPIQLPQRLTELPLDLGRSLHLDLDPQKTALSQDSLGYCFVEVATPEIVQQLQPDFALLKTLPFHAVIVTSRGNAPYDFVSRFFAPRFGINEDPVTGSAHCGLAAYWGDRLGKSQMLAYQASTRGGVVQVEVAGDRVILAGQAVTIFKGELF